MRITFSLSSVPTTRVARVSKLSKEQKAQLRQLVTEAQDNIFLLEIKHEDRTAILVEGEVVGFFTPQVTTVNGIEYWRAGALYLGQGYRSKNVMYEVLRDFFHSHKPAIAWIDDANTRSSLLFIKLGFVKWKAKAYSGKPGHWYLLNTKLQKH